jgi:FMN reductase
VAVPIAVGGGAGHLLAIDHGLRPLLTSLGATVVPGGVYGTPAGFADGGPTPALLERVDRAVVEAVSLAAATAWRLDSQRPERQVRHARAS